MIEIVHPESSEDWTAVRRICCETGVNGSPIEKEREAFFGRFWTGPYEEFCPEWAYVAKLDGTIAGYLNGCVDTRSLERSANWRFYPKMLLAALLGRYPWNSDVKRCARKVFRISGKAYSREMLEELHTAFPAHLHINVTASARKGGAGSALIGRYCEDLRRAGVRGVHLFCGPDPVGFYTRNGFREFRVVEFASGAKVFVM